MPAPPPRIPVWLLTHVLPPGETRSTILGDLIEERQGLVTAAAGTAVGLGGAALLTRVLERLLFGVKPSDPATLGAVAILLLVVAGVACYIPARRAARIDPLAALRTE
jgi:putative ABC transport system permease protein